MLKKEEAEKVLMDYDSLKEAGSALGTGAVMVFNTDVDLIASMIRFAQFYKAESCGQCTPCREGTEWLVQRLL
jgi:NADH dehydrogenase (ubiquinone) flavoprotein 1